MFQLVVSPAAQQDADEAIDYYQNLSSIKRNEFYDILQTLYQNLQTSPHHYSSFHLEKNLRSAAFIKYPYSIIFKVIGDKVYVIAVYNTHQNPDNLFKRIQ